jgi:hypothetical protein
LRAVFACDRDGVRQHTADAESGQKAQEGQLLRGLNHCRGQHAQAKECGGSNEHRPSANTIGNNAQEHRTKQHTNEPGAENGTESCRVDVPIMCQGGRDKSYGLDIEAIHDHRTPDQDHYPFLERTERTLIDQISDVHSRWIAGIRRSKGGGFRGHWRSRLSM